MKINKICQQISIILVVIILFSSFVSAFGVGAAYYKENPLKISAGETKEIIFNLKNGPGPEDVTVISSITQGSGILELVDSENVLVPMGGSVNIRTRITIPNDAEIGDTYPIEMTFTTVSDGAGAFGFSSSVSRKFDVIIVPTAEELEKQAMLAELGPISTEMIVIVVIVIALIIILIIWIKLRKKK
jgi:hypothetical protein